MKTPSFFWLVALLALGPFAAAVAQPQTPAPAGYEADRTGKLLIEGQVLGPDSSAVAGVTVSLADSVLATTDEQGRFGFLTPQWVMRRLPNQAVRIDFAYATLWEQTVQLGQKAPPSKCSLRVFIQMMPQKTQVKEDYQYPSRYTYSGYPVLGHGKVGHGSPNGSQVSEHYSAAGTRALPVVPSFPTQPPVPSTPEQLLPASFLAGAATLSEADARLTAALDKAGYNGRTRYYAYPSGYARTTLIEGIDAEARPLPSRPQRWPSDRPPKPNWYDWFKNLVLASPGHFRVLVFIVSTNDVISSGAPATAETVRNWVKTGPGVLPEHIGNMPYSPRHRCTVWVYEFRKEPGPGQATRPISSSYVTLEHLKQSGIMSGN